MGRTAKKTIIDWSSPDILNHLFLHIKSPLDSIINASAASTNASQSKSEIIFSSSKEISDLIEEILIEIKTKSVSLTIQSRPDIFDIYESNKKVQELCSNKLTPDKITKKDQNWLLNLEKEIYDAIANNDLDICDLSSKMAVSERQFHRKISNLVYLTPNKYIRILRLHKAKQLIDNYVQDSTSQVSYSVGYNDAHYFSKIFSDQYNISPKALISSLL